MVDQTHLSDDKIEYLLNSARGELPCHVAEHLSRCIHCQQRVERFAAENEAWNDARVCLAPGGQAYPELTMTNSLELTEFGRHCDEATLRQLLDAPTHPEMLGRVGRYEVERVIGSGGMGIVLKAYDSELHRSVAIKMLAPHLSNSGSARSRFAREARAAAAVVNDHVVPIHNVETDHTRPYLVMQYIAGDSLQTRIDREGTLELSEILRIGMQISHGLAAAHAQGLIHRDVKPSNIMLDENVSRALLTDFGLASAQDDVYLTRSGFHPGTPAFMSPEQIRGEELDGRSDLFGLGCVLYALCTGNPPFQAESSFAVMRLITDDLPPSIRQQKPDIPIWLERIVLRLLAKSQLDRFQSASEVGELLEQCLAHVQKPNQIPLPKSVCKLASSASFGGGTFRKWLVGGLIGLVAIYAGVIIMLESNKGTLTIHSDLDDVPIRIKQSDKVVDKLTVSRTGRTVRLAAGEYFVELDGDFQELVVMGDKVSLVRGDNKKIRVHIRKEQQEESLNESGKASNDEGLLLSLIESYSVKLEQLSPNHHELIRLRKEIESLRQTHTIETSAAKARLAQVTSERQRLLSELAPGHPRVREYDPRLRVLERLANGEESEILSEPLNTDRSSKTSFPPAWRGKWTISDAKLGEKLLEELIGQTVTISSSKMVASSEKVLHSRVASDNFQLILLNLNATPHPIDLAVPTGGIGSFVTALHGIIESTESQLILVVPQSFSGKRPKSTTELQEGETRFVLKRTEPVPIQR